MSRSEALRGNRNAAGHERIAGRAAIQQALFFHYGLTMREIATLLGLKYTTVYWNVWRLVGKETALLPWNARKHKAEAIRAANELLKHA